MRGELGPTKNNGSKRKIIISTSLAKQLTELRLKSYSTEFVFLNSKGGFLAPIEVTKQILRPACAKADVPEFGWHGLRRMYITQLFNRNVREDHVQTLAGHAPGSKVTRSIYNKVRAEDVLIEDYVTEF